MPFFFFIGMACRCNSVFINFIFGTAVVVVDMWYLLKYTEVTVFGCLREKKTPETNEFWCMWHIPKYTGCAMEDGGCEIIWLYQFGVVGHERGAPVVHLFVHSRPRFGRK